MHEIELPEVSWQSDIEDKKELSTEAKDLLDHILVRHNNHIPGVSATPELIEIAKKYFSQGVRMGTENFDIVVYGPEEENKVNGSFFGLVPKQRGRRLKYLDTV